MCFNVFLSPYNDVDLLINLYNNYCLSILDKAYPVKTRLALIFRSSVLFLSKSLALAERTHLHFHLLFLLYFNTLMQEARAAHSSNLVSKSRDNPKVLFDMVSDIVTSASPVISIYLKKIREMFLLSL